MKLGDILRTNVPIVIAALNLHIDIAQKNNRTLFNLGSVRQLYGSHLSYST